MNLAGYIRVSAVGKREGESYISPTVQRDAITRYASEINATVSDWFTDENFSGGNLDRPGFQAALNTIETGNADGLAVMRIDRFSRSVADGCRIVEDLIGQGKHFLSVHERIDPTTPEGRYMMTSFLATGQLYRDQTMAAWKTAKERAIARGALVGRTPFGYLRVRSDPSRENQVSPVEAARLMGQEIPSGVLIPDPKTGWIITDVFRRSAAGDTPGQIAAWVESESPAPRSQPWGSTAVRRWLVNRVYLGEIRYGDLVNDRAHLPLTDPATFQAAQPGRPRKMRRAGTLPYVGLLVCSGCGKKMVTGQFSGSDGRYSVYRCTGRDCPAMVVISTERVHQFIEQIVRQAVAGKRFAGGHADMADLDQQILEAEKEFDEFTQDLEARRVMGRDRWKRGIDTRAEHIDRLKADRDRRLEQQVMLEIDLDNPTDHDLRRLAFHLIDHIEIRRGRRGVAIPVADRAIVRFHER